MKKITIQFAGGELGGPIHDHNWEALKKDAAAAGSRGVIIGKMVKGEIILNLANVLFIGVDEAQSAPLVAAGPDALAALNGVTRN